MHGIPMHVDQSHVDHRLIRGVSRESVDHL
jgi:hypothetical protein